MNKLIILPILYGFYESPVIVLLRLITLIFLADLYNQSLESKKITCCPTKWNNWAYRDIQSSVQNLGY